MLGPLYPFNQFTNAILALEHKTVMQSSAEWSAFTCKFSDTHSVLIAVTMKPDTLQVIPYSLYLTDMKMMYMVCVVLSVMLGGLVTHSEA